jgi:predicted RNase H-like HicB family nuclease
MRYAVVIERDSTGSAYVPDLPGCAAAGKTVEEVRALIQGVPEPRSSVEYVDA